MNINDLTVGQAREIAQMFVGNLTEISSESDHSFVIGKNYFIRTVSYHYTGRLISVTGSDIVLEEAAWIADSGRWTDALKTGKLNEVEPYPGQVVINRDSIVDFSEWLHKLPREQK